MVKIKLHTHKTSRISEIYGRHSSIINFASVSGVRRPVRLTELCGAALHTHADPEFICALMIIMVGLDAFVGGPTDFQTVSVCVCVCVCGGGEGSL